MKSLEQQMINVLLLAFYGCESVYAKTNCSGLSTQKYYTFNKIYGILFDISIELSFVDTYIIISPDESRGYIGFRSVAPPPPPPPPPPP